MSSENQNYLFESEISKYDVYALRKVLSLFSSKKLKILEIGSWSGLGSTKVFAEYSREIVCVDTWLGNNVEHHNNAIKNIDPYQAFMQNTADFNDKVRIIKKKSDQALDELSNEKFDVIFIDADHRYDYVKSDIERALNILDENGVIIGHDCELNLDDCNEEQRKIVKENVNKDTIVSISKNFKHNHCGVIQAVNEFKYSKFLFCNAPFRLNEKSEYSSIFVLQKKHNKFFFPFQKIMRLEIARLFQMLKTKLNNKAI